MTALNEQTERAVSTSEEGQQQSQSIEFKSRFLENFELVRFLGKGAFGWVFEVQKKRYDKKFYAVKRIEAKTSETEDNMREVTVS